jgi:hypothetical protein
MASEEMLDEARRLAGQVLALSPDEVSRLFYTEMKRRKLGRLVRLLDRLAAQDGEDRRAGSLALERLGFSVGSTPAEPDKNAD